MAGSVASDRSSRLRLLSLALVLLLLAATGGACSKDDKGGSGTTTSAAPETTTTTEARDTTTTTDDDTEVGGLSPAAEETMAALGETFAATPEEEECLADAFDDNPEIFEAMDDPSADPAAVAQALQVAIDCLDPETVAAAFAEGLLSEAPDLSDEQVECLTDGFLGLPPEVLGELVLLGDDPMAQPSPDALVATFEVLGSCELGDAFAEDLGLTGLTDEQASCYVEGIFDLETDLLLEIFSAGQDPTAEPSPEMMTALMGIASDCGIDPAAL